MAQARVRGKTIRVFCCEREAGYLYSEPTPTNPQALFMLPSLDFLQTLAQQHGDEIAMEDASAQVSYSELITAVNALAVALQVKDPIPGSRVGLCAANSMEYVVSMLAILAAGKTLVPMNCYGTPEQQHQILLETHPSAIIVDKLGDALIKSEDELKIPFSQFPGLVLTYRDQKPQRHDGMNIENT